VLIIGETGTGKEVLAREIHLLGGVGARPFIPVECAAIPVDLFENELFGHEGGAYTNASTAQEGIVHAAEGGTLFLDEIDTVPLAAQAKLLRLIQERGYRPLGTPHTVRADVLIVAASNANLEAMVQEGKLRQDLFYRIAVFTVKVPPLRERKEDIPQLAKHFLTRHGHPHSPTKSLSQGALSALRAYGWPGNVRELENLMQRMVVEVEGDVISEEQLGMPGSSNPNQCEPFNQARDQNEREFQRNYLEMLLLRTKGNVTEAAKTAKVGRRTLHRLLEKLEMGSHTFRGVT
jgi:two-component system response regulator GlrR